MLSMSDLCSYHAHNPDPQFSTCRNTGFQEPGVVFSGIEPLEGIHTFIGQTSLVEAVALIYGLTPKQVESRLKSEAGKHLRVKVGRLEEEKKFLADRLAEINKFIIDGKIPVREVEALDGEPHIA